MSKTTVLLLVTVALAGLGILGLVLHEGGAERGRDEARPEGVATRPVAPAEGLTAPRTTASEPAQRAEAPALAPGAGAGDRQSFAIADARWVEVRVVLPAGVPADDAPALVALSSSTEPDGARRMPDWRLTQAAAKVGLGERFEQRLDGSVGWARRELQGSTTLSMPFAPDARNGLIVLQSRYVYAEPVVVRLSDATPPVTIEGELGSYLTGSIVPPVDAGRTFSPADFELRLLGRNKEGSLDFLALGGNSLDVEVRDDLGYEVRALSARLKYFVRVEARGLVDFAELDLVVEPGEHRVLDVPLARGASVTGRVLGADGRPIADASVSSASRGRGLLFLLENSEQAESDASGAYCLRGLPAGKALLSAEADGWLSRSGIELVLAEGVDVQGQDIVLERGSEVAGTVRWPSGQPAAGARVRVGKTQHEGWPAFQSDATCDEAGRFVLSGLQEGPFELGAQATPPGDAATQRVPGAWSAIARGVRAGDHEVELLLEAPLSLAGHVVDDLGQPVQSFHVDADSLDLPRWLLDVPGQDIEAEDGAFQLDGLRAGSWKLSAKASGYGPPEAPLTVDVPAAGDTRIVLQRAVRVTGLVVDPNGAPVPEATVRASAGPEGPFGQGRSAQQTGSDAEGRFELEFPGTALALVASRDGWADSEPVTVELGPGAASGEVVLALRAGGTIRGEVFAPDGRPDPGIRVMAGDMPFWFGEGAGVVSDADGRFVLEHVNPGKVTVTAMPREESLRGAMEKSADEELAVMSLLTQMRTATVVVADREEVHVVLGSKAKASVRLTGTVSEGGAPLAGAGVFALEEGNSFLQGMRVAKSDSAGHYALELDRPGSFVVSVSLQGIGQSAAEFFVDVPEVPEYRLDLPLPLATLGGRVLGPDASPAVGVTLNLVREGAASGPTMMNITRGHVTDSEGRFRFEHLHAGSYTLQVGAALLGGPGAGAPQGSLVLEGLAVEEGVQRDDLEIRLPATTRVSGVVRRADRSPALGATVYARDAAGRLLSDLSTCQSDAAGRFVYAGLPVGKVTLFARTADLASREVGVELDASGASEVELFLEPGGTLLVSLLEGDQPVRGSLTVLDEQGRRVSGVASVASFEGLMIEGLQTKEVRVGPLPPGNYTVIGRATDGKEARKTVTLREPDERVVKLRLK
jgi:hypothetical protein